MVRWSLLKAYCFGSALILAMRMEGRKGGYTTASLFSSLSLF